MDANTPRTHAEEGIALLEAALIQRPRDSADVCLLLKYYLPEFKRELTRDETWTDENGTTWRRPTAWAYAQSCRVREEQRQRADSLEASLAKEEENTLHQAQRATSAEATVSQLRAELAEARKAIRDAADGVREDRFDWYAGWLKQHAEAIALAQRKGERT